MALYQCGVTPDCPFQVVHVSGKEFPKTTEKVEGYGTQTKRTQFVGVVLDLTENEVEAIKSAVKRKFVRSTHGTRKKSRLVDSKTKSYRPFPQDEPLAKYVYMKRVDHDPHKGLEVETLADEADASKQAGGKRKAS